jgi:hypothetical protein
MPAPEHQIARLEFVVREQMKEIDKLREEVARLTADADAHATLRSIYTNPEASRTDRVKAAAASLPFERPKLMPERAPLELQATDAEVIPLRQLVEFRKERQERMEREAIEAERLLTLNGNGSDEH